MAPLEDDGEAKLEPEEIIAEGAKLNPRKRKVNRNNVKNLNSKQIIN